MCIDFLIWPKRLAGGKVVVMYEYQLNVVRFGSTLVVAVPIAYQKKICLVSSEYCID
jgi:hypothetical protein